jgi:hypothetical protein
VIHNPEKPSSVEQKKACDAGVSMELTYGLGKHRAAEFSLLDQPLRLGEPASVAGGAAIDLDGVNHPVAVEEVVPSDGFEQRVGSVAEVNAVNAFGDCAGDWEFSPDWLFRYRSEVSGDLDSWVGGFGKWVSALE